MLPCHRLHIHRVAQISGGGGTVFPSPLQRHPFAFSNFRSTVAERSVWPSGLPGAGLAIREGPVCMSAGRNAECDRSLGARQTSKQATNCLKNIMVMVSEKRICPPGKKTCWMRSSLPRSPDCYLSRLCSAGSALAAAPPAGSGSCRSPVGERVPLRVQMCRQIRAPSLLWACNITWAARADWSTGSYVDSRCRAPNSCAVVTHARLAAAIGSRPPSRMSIV